MLHQRSNNSFARQAARAALAPNHNITNIQNSTPLKEQVTNDSDAEHTLEIDKIVESVTNATKRLSQISINTNSYERKSKSHVGPWRLGRTLGRGSTGRVRLAKHSETGQLAAVKIVPKSKFQKNKGDDNKETSPYGIEREIIIMKLISHENIMGLYDVWENKGELYLVLEYVEGGELFDYLIKKGKLDEKEAVHYFRQIISGVSYCHQFNICHRDLKPENLLLDKNLNIKIADFGMAALEINHKLLETSCGSPHYASPEIVAGKTYHGSPSDVWSCGIILFALLTGHLPFDDENIRKLLMKVQSGRFVTPSFLSSEAKDLIWKMLKVNPNDRIKVFDILKHPLLKKYENSTNLNSNKNDKVQIEIYYHDVSSLKLSRDKIDRDLLTSLSILFHGVKESLLIPKLLEPGSNPEKVFYYLLQQYKEKHKLKASQESKSLKKTVSNGDGLLKKSKSTIHTTIVNQNGATLSSTTTTEKQPPLEKPPQLLKKSASKKITKNSQSQLQISASSTYRRGVSFNNKQINNLPQPISRSSSKIKISDDKKRHSILPPLPDLDNDWLKLDPADPESKGFSLDSKEFAALYEAVFSNMDTPTVSKRKLKKNKDPFAFTSSPIPIKKKEHKVKEKHNVDIISAEVRSKISSGEFNTSSTKRFISEPPLGGKPILQKSSTLKLSALIDFKTGETPIGLTKKSTLDPKYKRKTIANNNVDVLNRVGVSLRNSRIEQSKIFYSKSSTSRNLNNILTQKNENEVLSSKTKDNELLNSQANPEKPSADPPTLDTRISSSNYPSFEEESIFNTSNDEGSFDFEVPVETEVAEAIQIANGSDLTVGKNVQAREDSMFEDIETGAVDTENFFKISNSTKSIVKHHKQSPSDDIKVLKPSVDVRGSWFNTDTKDYSISEQINKTNHGYQRPRYPRQSEETDEAKSIALDNSLYTDNTDDDNEFANAKRVTMIFDEYDNTFADSPVPAVFKSTTNPIRSSSLKSIQEKSFKRNSDGTFLKLKKLSTVEETSTKEINNTEKVHNSNWFTRFFSSLVSENKHTPKKSETRTFTPKRSFNETKKNIRNVLEIKRKEGTLTSLKVNGQTINATIPSTFALGRPLKFEIAYNDESNQISLTKVKGSKKIFKSLINAMEYVIENDTF